MDPSTLLGLVGAVLSFLAMLIVTLIGFIVRFVLSTTDQRIGQIETATQANTAKLIQHGEQFAEARIKTEGEQKSLDELWSAVDGLRRRFDELLAHLRQNGSVG